MKLHRPSKRMTIITAVVLTILLGLGVYSWQSVAMWRGYEARLLKEQQSYQELKNEALSGDTADKRLTAVRTLDDKIAQRSELCKVNSVFAWQATIIPVLKAGVKQCEDKVKQLGLVATPLRGLRQYLDAGVKVQAIVEPLSPGEVLTDKNWVDKGLARAKQAQTELKDLRVSDDDGIKLKDQAVNLSNNLVKAWESLVKANEAKDKTGFLSASAEVINAYVDFAGLADSSDAAIKQKANAVVNAASNL